MGLTKSFADAVSDVVEVELKILPALITALAPAGVPSLLAGAVLGVTPRSLKSITKQSFEGEGLTIEQSRAINFVRAQQGLATINKFGQVLTAGSFTERIVLEDIDAARRAASLSTRGVGLGSPLPDVDRALLVDNPFLTRTASNLGVRIPDTAVVDPSRPRTGGGLVLEPAPTTVPPSRAVPLPSLGTAPLKEKPMGSFFETLGDRLLAGGEDIFKGFVTGGISGGLQAGAQALLETGGAPAGFGGVPPRIARAQAETRGMLTGLSPLPATVGGVQPVGFGGVSRAARRFLPTPITGRLLGLGAGAVGAGAVFKRVAPISTAGFRKPGGFPPGIPPQGTRLFMGGGGGAAGFGARERFGETSLSIVEGGKMAGQSNFAKDECNRTLKFFCSPRPGEGWVNVDDAASLGLKARKPFARFNIMENRFQSIPRRRMNVANIKALGRAERRRRDFMDLVLPLIRDRKKEQAGTRPRLVVAKKRKKRRKVA